MADVPLYFWLLNAALVAFGVWDWCTYKERINRYDPPFGKGLVEWKSKSGKQQTGS